MKLISWNVNKGFKHGLEQVKVLGEREPHVVALQDITESAATRYEKAFVQIGLPHVTHTFQGNLEKTPTGILIASCFEGERLPLETDSVLWREGYLSDDPEKVKKHWAKRTLFVTLQSPWGKIDLYNAYITPGSHMENTPEGRKMYASIKLDLLSGMYHALAMPTDRLRILCGDFNTPQEETATGETITWGQSYSQRKGCYYVNGEEQHKAEMRILRGLAEHDLSDVYRRVHGYGSEKVGSWKTYRYDHIFASQALVPQCISYLNLLKEHRLSDHIPIEVVFAPQTNPQEAEITS